MEINVLQVLTAELSSVRTKNKGAPMMCSSKTCSSKWKTLAASFVALVLIHSVALHVDVQAQVAGGTITGTVVDSSGRVLPNASVSITNVATGIKRSLTTNDDGYYIAPNLLPAS